jgi:hypothetical protein
MTLDIIVGRRLANDKAALSLQPDVSSWQVHEKP